MKNCTIPLFLGLLLLSFGSSGSAETSGAVLDAMEEPLRAYREQHRSAMEEIRKDDREIIVAQKAYLNILDGLIKQYEQSGDLDLSRAVEKEKERYSRAGVLDDHDTGDLPDAVDDVRQRFRQQLQAAKERLNARMVNQLRMYRIRLLDLQRSADASDDDDVAAISQLEIDRIDALILKFNADLAGNDETSAEMADRLPAGLEDGLVLSWWFDRPAGRRVWDSSGNSHHGLATGARWSGNGRSGGAFWFDGLDDAIETDPTATFDLERSVTVSICIYRGQGYAATAGMPEYPVSLSSSAAADFWLYISPGQAVGAGLGASDKLQAAIHIPAEPSTQQLGLNRWEHVVFTFDDTIARLYVNGRLDKTVSTPEGLSHSGFPLNVGRSGPGRWRYGFTGRVDDVLVWNRALSEAEVLGLWVSLKRSATDSGQLGSITN